MAIHKYKCRICKKITEHKQIDEFDGLPKYVICGQCLGCGVMGIQMEEDITHANVRV